MHFTTRFPISFILGSLALVTALRAQEPPLEYIDKDTGHRVVRLSREPGTASLYFNQNAYTPDGRKLVVTSPSGISTIDLATREVTLVVPGEVRVIMAGHKTGDVYYTKREGEVSHVYATNLTTKATRDVAKLPRGGVASINANETLMLGVYTEGDQRPPPDGGRGRRGDQAPAPEAAAAATGPMSNTAASQPNNGGTNPTFQAAYSAKWPDGTPMAYADAKDLALHNRLMAIRRGPPQVIFTVNIQTGEIREVLKEREWIGHLQFSPTDPQQIMFCHEGTWHEVDRVWLIRTDGTGLTKAHTRTLNMEIAGHEFFNADGSKIWYDLQTPRGEDFWLAGYELATKKRTWYHLQRDEWSVHYNVSQDGTLFSGDGGDNEMVAHATNGKWLYLFRPRPIPDVAGVKNPNSENLIATGAFEAERLVNLANHKYQLEPNASFTPDMKWLVFRSNLFGPVHTYAVEIARAK